MSGDVFVKVEKIEQVERNIKDVETKIQEAKVTLRKLKELNESEARELAEWEHYLSSIENKVEDVKEHLD